MFQLDDDFEVDENFLDEVLSKNCNSPNKLVEPQHTPILIKNDPKSNDFSKAILPCGVSPSLSAGSGPNVSFLKDLTSKVRSRKFPGPAGLLPERQINTPLVATEDFLDELEAECFSEDSFKEGEILSQATVNSLQGVLWEAVLNDFGVHGQELVKLIDINSVRSKAKLVRAIKVPFLVLTLQNLDTSTPDPCLFLRDPSGEMCGALHRDVWEKFSEELVPDSVLVLINVGVVSAGTTSLRHYLNITANNVCAIYSTQKDGSIKVTRINPICEEHCLRFLQDWKSLKVSQQRSPPSSPSIFTSVIPGTPQRPPAPINRFQSPLPSTSQRSQRLMQCGYQAQLVKKTLQVTNTTRHNLHDSNTMRTNQQASNSTRQDLQISNSSKHKLQVSNAIKKPLNPVNTPPSKPSPSQVHVNYSQDMFNQSLQVPMKKPRQEPPTQTFSDIFPGTQASQDLQNQSIVESLLEGIDADSLFGDF